MKLGYPNLELLDYKAREIIQELIYIPPNKHYYFELEAITYAETEDTFELYTLSST